MKWRQALIVSSFLFTAFFANAQNSVGIGVANPNKHAVLELISPGNNQGILIPKLTTAQRTSTSFVGALTTKENGLMVFDSDQKKFYYWDATAWKELGTGGNLSSGDGISIVGTTISTIPQDLEISGGTLKITGNSTTTPINLTDLNIPQDIKITGTTLTVTNNPGATPINLSDLNIPQDLQLNGSTLTITNNTSATPINLSAFTGTNTDDQTLTYDGATGNLSISRLTGGALTVNIPLPPASTPPSGSAGGDLTGTYPNPTITNNAITTSKIADGSVASADITDGTVASIDIADGTVASVDITDGTVASADILDGTVATADITDLTITNADINAAAGIVVSKLAASGTPGQILTTVGATTQWANAPAASGTAGGDLTGTYPNPDIAANAVTTAEILDGTVASADILDGTVATADITDLTITNADINAAAGIVVSKLAASGTPGQILTTVGATTQWANAPAASGTAGGDLTGTYPNPDIAANAVTTAEILDGTVASADILDGTVATADITDLTITNADINAAAGIVVSKLAASGTPGQILTTVGVTTQWANAPAASGAAGGDLTGTYPNPDIAANAVTTAEILDATVASADITDGTVASIDIADGTVASIDITDNSITTADILDNTVATADILDNTVTSTDITDLTITNADINAGAGILVSKLAASGTPGQILTTVGVNTQWANAPAASGPAGGDLTGTYPNPDIAANAVTTNEINDLTITNNDISATAAVAVSKLAPGTNGFILQTTAGTAVWAAPGASALISAPGTRNLFAGSPMAGTAGGTDNAFYGSSAGSGATVGSWNAAFGTQAGQNMAQGSLNSLFGWHAGNATTTATFNGNTFIGAQAGEAATGGPNTFIGEKAGQTVSTGTENVFVGNRAGLVVTTGGRNTILGYFADVTGSNTQNSIAIGYSTVVDASNKVRIGNNAITVIEGQVAFTNPSDRRFKTNIRPIDAGLDFIMKLKPVTYNMKNSTDTRFNWGFIAQDIQSLVGDTNAVLTVSQNQERHLGLRYSDFVAPLVKAVQEQQVQITDLNEKLTESEKKVELLMAEIEQIKKAIGLKASKK